MSKGSILGALLTVTVISVGTSRKAVLSLDGFSSHTGDWGGYWGKHGP